MGRARTDAGDDLRIELFHVDGKAEVTWTFRGYSPDDSTDITAKASLLLIACVGVVSGFEGVLSEEQAHSWIVGISAVGLCALVAAQDPSLLLKVGCVYFWYIGVRAASSQPRPLTITPTPSPFLDPLSDF